MKQSECSARVWITWVGVFKKNHLSLRWHFLIGWIIVTTARNHCTLTLTILWVLVQMSAFISRGSLTLCAAFCFHGVNNKNMKAQHARQMQQQWLTRKESATRTFRQPRGLLFCCCMQTFMYQWTYLPGMDSFFQSKSEFLLSQITKKFPFSMLSIKSNEQHLCCNWLQF